MIDGHLKALADICAGSVASGTHLCQRSLNVLVGRSWLTEVLSSGRMLRGTQ